MKKNTNIKIMQKDYSVNPSVTTKIKPYMILNSVICTYRHIKLLSNIKETLICSVAPNISQKHENKSLKLLKKEDHFNTLKSDRLKNNSHV